MRQIIQTSATSTLDPSNLPGFTWSRSQGQDSTSRLPTNSMPTTSEVSIKSPVIIGLVFGGVEILTSAVLLTLWWRRGRTTLSKSESPITSYIRPFVSTIQKQATGPPEYEPPPPRWVARVSYMSPSSHPVTTLCLLRWPASLLESQR